MNILSIEDIKKEVNAQGFKHVGLFNQNSESVVPYNTTKVPVKQRIAEIEKRLQSKALPDGVYMIMAKNALGSKVKPDVFYVAKGDISKTNQETDKPSVILKVPLSDGEKSVITYERALQMQVEIAELKMENKLLQEENEELKEAIADYEDTQLNDPAPTMLDNASAFFQQVAPFLTPLVDKYHEQKDRELAIMERRLDLMSNNKSVPPKPKAKPQDRASKFIHHVARFDADEDTKAIIQSMVEAYNQSKDLPDFEIRLRELSEEMYEAYLNFINQNNHE